MMAERRYDRLLRVGGGVIMELRRRGWGCHHPEGHEELDTAPAESLFLIVESDDEEDCGLMRCDPPPA